MSYSIINDFFTFTTFSYLPFEMKEKIIEEFDQIIIDKLFKIRSKFLICNFRNTDEIHDIFNLNYDKYLNFFNNIEIVKYGRIYKIEYKKSNIILKIPEGICLKIYENNFKVEKVKIELINYIEKYLMQFCNLLKNIIVEKIRNLKDKYENFNSDRIEFDFIKFNSYSNKNNFICKIKEIYEDKQFLLKSYISGIISLKYLIIYKGINMNMNNNYSALITDEFKSFFKSDQDIY